MICGKRVLSRRPRMCLFTTVLFLVALGALSLWNAKAARKYVYYGYVPEFTSGTLNWVDYIGGKPVNFTVPPNHAVLALIGMFDGTKVEVWNLITKEKIAEATLDYMERRLLFLPSGTFFKVESNKRVAVALFGGPAYTYLGAATFYPSREGGFVGREFVFLAFTVSDTYIAWRAGRNALIHGLESAEFKIVDSTRKFSTSDKVDQNGFKDYILNCIVWVGQTLRGAGASTIFEVTASGLISVSCWTSTGFSMLPAAGGGFVGKLFMGLTYVSVTESGSAGAFVVVPVEPCEVEVYDDKWNLVAKHKFTEEDVAEGRFWFYKVGATKKLIFKSTGDITVLCGDTFGITDPYYMGDDITFGGVRGGQEIAFFAPTEAVLFAPEDTKVIVDGEEYFMHKDGYMILEAGVHRVKPEKTLIIEILGQAAGWQHFGSYLVCADDIESSYTVPEGYGSPRKGIPYEYIALGVIVAIIAVIVYIKRFRRRGP